MRGEFHVVLRLSKCGPPKDTNLGLHICEALSSEHIDFLGLSWKGSAVQLRHYLPVRVAEFRVNDLIDDVFVVDHSDAIVFVSGVQQLVDGYPHVLKNNFVDETL